MKDYVTRPVGNVPNERLLLSGLMTSLGGSDDFLNCVTQSGLYDCRYRGNYFTWSNKQLGSDRVVSKIDRVLVNGLWMQELPNAEVEFRNSQQDFCPLCGYEAETESHLFFLCTYSSYVWDKILQLLRYSKLIYGWEEELQWCIQHFRGSGVTITLKKVAFNATVYHLWMERNKRLYERQFSTGTDLVHRICTDVRLKFSAGTWTAEDTQQTRHLMNLWNLDFQLSCSTPRQCSWTKPPMGWYKLNSDGSLRNDDSLHGTKGGYGAILRDASGEAIAACAGDCRGQSVIKHELQGVSAGLKLAAMHNAMRIELSTDSSTVFSYLTSHKSVSWDLRRVIGEIRSEISKLEEFSCKHDYRETNRAADFLASTFPTSDFIEFTPSSFAEDLKKIVYEDKIGKIYLRL